jgi:predicted transcriptional regulator of viral defense system
MESRGSGRWTLGGVFERNSRLAGIHVSSYCIRQADFFGRVRTFLARNVYIANAEPTTVERTKT